MPLFQRYRPPYSLPGKLCTSVLHFVHFEKQFMGFDASVKMQLLSKIGIEVDVMMIMSCSLKST